MNDESDRIYSNKITLAFYLLPFFYCLSYRATICLNVDKARAPKFPIRFLAIIPIGHGRIKFT